MNNPNQKHLPSALIGSKVKAKANNLGGGSIVVNKRKSNIVANKSPKKGGSYSNYLNFQKGGQNTTNAHNVSGHNVSGHNGHNGGGSRKVLIKQRRSRGGGRIKACKNQKQKQEIPEIPILERVVRKDAKKPGANPVANRVEKEVKRPTNKVRERRERRDRHVPDKVDKRVRRPSQKREIKRGTRKSRNVRRDSRRDSRRASTKRRGTRRGGLSPSLRGLNGGQGVGGQGGRGSMKKDQPKKGRKVSVSVTRTLGKKETEKMQKKIKDIQTKTTADMVKELEKEGVKVSGKSKTILKDIYMYHKMCGINIKRE